MLCFFFIRETKCCTCVITGGRGHTVSAEPGSQWPHCLFLTSDAMHSADYAVARCLSVRLSVTRRYSVEMPQHIGPKTFFTVEYPPHSGFRNTKRYDNIPTPPPPPLTAAYNARGYEKIAIFDQCLILYLRNDTRYSRSYYGMRIANLTQTFEWYHFQ